jgi:hypothetical protein
MKVGNYVRTPNGLITKIIGVQDEENQYFINNNAVSLKSKTYIADKNLTIGENFKHSPNIIDLIQVGDYVNGKKVIDTFTDYIFDYSEEFKVIRFSETDILHDVKHIKSIVTKEQFENMSYKVGD